MILKFELSVDTTTGEFSVVNTETGEVKSVTTKVAKKTSKKKEESSTPQLILEDNKYSLNSAAVELMNLSPDDKVDIKYEKNGKAMQPIIGSDEVFGTHGGNRLTKSNTVACRGSKHDELSKYGTVFTITPHKTKEGLFVLAGDKVESIENEEITLEEGEEKLPFDVDLEELIDEKDANIEEIDSSFFKL